MKISNLNSISLTYHGLQGRRVELNRRRINAKLQTVFSGRVIPNPADLPIGHGRRLQAAVLFLDICGFTARASETAAEQETQVRVLSLFISEMIRIVEDYGGTVEKNTGDGLMAYFAQSAGPGDVRQRSVACAMSMFHGASEFINPIIANSNLDEIKFRVCIDYGWITVARLGAAQRFNHIVAVGTSANRTSKMLRHADANEILIGDAMLGGLPANWLRDHVSAKTLATGWQHLGGANYTFWLFDGRWNVPQR
jgi:adenylate cyclase